MKYKNPNAETVLHWRDVATEQAAVGADLANIVIHVAVLICARVSVCKGSSWVVAGIDGKGDATAARLHQSSSTCRTRVHA